MSGASATRGSWPRNTSSSFSSSSSPALSFPTPLAPPPPIFLRPATPEDVPLILSLIRALAEYERAPQDVVATESLLQEHLFGDCPAAHVLLACAAGEPIGFALYFFNFSTWLGRPGLYLEDLFVLPGHRRHGHGRALLQRLGQIAHERGCGRMEWAVLGWNHPAIEFYQTLGAKPMDEWTIFRLTREGIARLAGA